VVTRIDFNTLTFGEPLYLWLLAVPGVLLALWILQVVRRRADTRRYAQQRVVPVRERFTLFGDLAFWLALVVAASLCIVALARPQARVVIVRKAGADIVILQDGSASMYVKDVKPDRWRRSVQFLRVFADALSWKGDRVALALFAHTVAPQVRLTKDPNSFFFFTRRSGSRTIPPGTPTSKKESTGASSWSRRIRSCSERSRTRRGSWSSPTARRGRATSPSRFRPRARSGFP
jgi:hypothetical protein